jgi:hypothetical protein
MIPREAFFNRENLQRLGVPAPSQGGSTPFKGTNLALASGPAKAGPHVALWCLLILLLLPIGARAQARLTGSDLTGRVTDESGADTSTDFQSAFMPENNGQGRNPADPTGLPVGFDPRRERGTSSQDQRHRLVVSGLYQLPFAMQLSAIVTAASGRPFTALAGADLNGDGDGGAFPPDRARRDPANPETSVGRYSETMPSQVIADVRLSKRFTVRNGMTVMAMIEAFNLFDRANFSEVNNIFGRGAFPDEPQRDTQGRVTYGRFEQALPPRQVQLAMRVTF